MLRFERFKLLLHNLKLSFLSLVCFAAGKPRFFKLAHL